MSERLRSVGLDVGTTSTQLVLSELRVENQAGSFAVPELEIAERKILYKSPVYFTPLRDESHVDGAAIREIVVREYARAGIRREDVDTGAIIITGETSRKENARAVLSALSDFAGEFVVATAGPDLESVLAARGSGAVDDSEDTGQTVLHMDIGGGTSNLALIRDGKITQTGCLNVGGRLLKFDKNGTLTYVSPVLREMCTLKAGDRPTEEQVEDVAAVLVQALEMAAGLRQRTPLLEQLWTREHGAVWDSAPADAVISFSGGVAECIAQDVSWLEYGDMGPVLGRVIRGSRLCQGSYRIGEDAIRATVIGAGCHSAQLSGSTIFCQNVALPLKNLPVVRIPEGTGEGLTDAICREIRRQESTAVIALPGIASPGYAQVAALAEEIAAVRAAGPWIICLEQDMAKALGQALALRLGRDAQILCIDRVRLPEGSYLDVGQPVGPALPVVVKTIIFAGERIAAPVTSVTGTQ